MCSVMSSIRRGRPTLMQFSRDRSSLALVIVVTWVVTTGVRGMSWGVRGSARNQLAGFFEYTAVPVGVGCRVKVLHQTNSLYQ